MSNSIRLFLGSAILALCAALVMEALSLYGVVSMEGARIALTLAWLVAVIGVGVSQYLSESRLVFYKVSVSALVAIGLFGVFWLLDKWVMRQKSIVPAVTIIPKSESPSASDIASEVAKRLLRLSRKQREQAAVVDGEPKPSIPTESKSAPEPVGMYFECDYKPIPRTVPDGGLRALHFVAAIPDPHGSHEIPLFNPGTGKVVHLGQYFGLWDADPEKNYVGYLCRITNYGKDPVFKVEFIFRLEFRAANDSIVLATGWPAQIRRIEPGLSGTFTCFLVNTSEYVLNVSLPRYVTLRPLGEDQGRTVKLLSSYDDNGFHAVQFRPMKNPKQRQ